MRVKVFSRYGGSACSGTPVLPFERGHLFSDNAIVGDAKHFSAEMMKT
jgi:hypothetical protein